MKFRKKPIEIEAVQWLGTKQSFDAIRAMGDIRWKSGPMGSKTFIIETLEGDMIASDNDWIIKEPFAREGRQFYPCKPDIFEQTYEKA